MLSIECHVRDEATMRRISFYEKRNTSQYCLRKRINKVYIVTSTINLYKKPRALTKVVLCYYIYIVLWSMGPPDQLMRLKRIRAGLELRDSKQKEPA